MIYIKEWECNDGKTRGVTQFLTANPDLKSLDQITTCATDFEYDIGYQCFSTDEKPYWYSCDILKQNTYTDDPSQPAHCGSSGNYIYTNYEIEHINAKGIVDEEEQVTYFTQETLFGFGELAHIPTNEYRINPEELNVQIKEIETPDNWKIWDTFEEFGNLKCYIIYNTGFIDTYMWGEFRKTYNPHTRCNYTVDLNDYSKSWAKDYNDTSNMDIIAVYTEDIENNTDILYISI